jgi:hypothetical protein
LSERTRAQLISDIFNLAQAGYVEADLPLELATYMINEIGYLPWSTFLNRIKFYIDILDSSPFYNYLQYYLQTIIEPYFEIIGWSHNTNWLNR